MAPAPPLAFKSVFEDSTPLKIPISSTKGSQGGDEQLLFAEVSGPSSTTSTSTTTTTTSSSSSSTTTPTPTSSSISSSSSQPQLTFLCLPGIGDFRQQYRFLGPMLRKEGHRVIVADLRGHGDSSANFPSYTPLDVSGDIGAILGAAGVESGAVLVGNSLAASSALHFAATHPEQVAAVVCLAPVARDLPQDKTFRPLSHLLFSPPWGAALWVSYFDSLFKLNRPGDLEGYKAALLAKTREKGRLAAVGRMMRGSKTPCFQEAGRVQCPVLLLHGEKDPDFASPEKEAEEVKAALTASKAVQVEVVPGVGHYPHVEEPQKSLDAISAFLAQCL